MSAEDGDIVFTPPQTCADFMVSKAFFRLIAGPVGSAKTTACIFELYRRAAEQAVGPDGYRRTRFAIVRQTLQQLKQTVLKDILLWLPGIATWKVSESTIYIACGDIRSEWVFVPLENIEDQRRLLSSQLTGVWLSECIEISYELVGPISGRCGRFPGPKQGGCTWYGLIADTNMPEEATRWHHVMDIDTPPDMQVFIQPGGLDDKAENLQWLNQTPESLRLNEDNPIRIERGKDFYRRLARNPSPAWVNRYVNAKYGIDPSGAAVFAATFQYTSHVVEKLEPLRSSLIIIGQDFGRDPFSVITQMTPWGQLYILEELVADDIGLEVHIQRNLRPRLMDPRYIGCPIIVVGDPSGTAKSSLFEMNNFDLLKQHRFTCFPASTNDLDPRIRSVESWLMKFTAQGPGMLIDRGRCPNLISGMKGGYRYLKNKPNQLSPTGENKAKPDKNNYSHVCDALQYACLAWEPGALSYLQRFIFGRVREANPQPKMSSRAWT
jgi:hypothetical protein